ncbi:hypothetical protein [Streptomyces sp. NPDC056682]|uniref:hypothetical protein n=1 Tax=Streptomyces sp. NPDC056682 TaxID=3345909 RepID=UPI00369957AC
MRVAPVVEHLATEEYLCIAHGSEVLPGDGTERAMGQPGPHGIVINSHIGRRYLDEPEFAPL